MIKQLDATESIEILQEYCSQLDSELQRLESAIDSLADSEALEDSDVSMCMSCVMAAFHSLNDSLYVASLSDKELERLL